MTRALRFITILVSLTAIDVGLPSSHAQHIKKFHRIGYLDSSSFSGIAPLLRVFESRLREFGWVEEKNIVFDYQFANGRGFGRLQDLANDLARRRVDVIVTRGTNGAEAAKRATSTIPIVLSSGGDPVGSGLIENLARPGGNITGVNTLSPELITKRLEILREVVPKLARLGVLGTEPDSGPRHQREQLERAARSVKVNLRYFGTGRRPNGFENAFETAARQRVDAIISVSNPTHFAGRTRIVELAEKYRLPAIYPTIEFVEAGGLMSYGVDNPDQFRRAAVYVDKILRGANPGDLPVEQPNKFEVVINLKAAKQIGVTIPPAVLMDSDRVIK
jgi:putative ABC transport system substrate-binding protein